MNSNFTKPVTPLVISHVHYHPFPPYLRWLQRWLLWLNDKDLLRRAAGYPGYDFVGNCDPDTCPWHRRSASR